MINGKIIVAFIIGISLFLPTHGSADEAAELKKEIMFDQKKLIVMENMDFSDSEKKFFWPVYESMQNELFEVNQRSAKLIVAYAAAYQTLTDDQAAKIVAEYFDIEESRTAVLKRYAQKLSKGLPAKKVFRYIQVENKLAALARYELAKEIPLAQ